MDTSEIAGILEDLAVLLELKGENPFKIRAYQNGARALERLGEDLGTVLEEGRLASVKGIGEALAEKIEVLYREGRLDYYDEIRESVAPGVREMLEIPGLGGKSVRRLCAELGVESVAGLETACREGRVAALKGFGPKSEEKILTGIANRAAYAKRHLWWNAEELARPILEGLRGLPEVRRAEVAGSLRRLAETVGDLDFIVESEKPGPVMDWFTARDAIAEITAKGETKSSVRFEGGLQADLRVVGAEAFPFALHHFTGSKEHNVALRQRALARGLSLSEWGFVEKDKAEEGTSTGFGITTERELFAHLGLAEIPPELREGDGELEAAEAGALPELVEADAVRGVFHNHTVASDGRATIAEMAEGARLRGWEYLGLADHSKASFQANGLDDGRVLAQAREIRDFNRSGASPVSVFAGIECDILPDGSLDLAEETLRALDYVVISVHSSFGMSEKEMTGRIIRAIEHPASTILGHPTGRLLLRREPYRVDLGKIIDAAAANQVLIEINAHPRRLDMDWRWWRRAKERGVGCVISPDAHEVAGLDYCRAGIHTARKGWLEAADILNCRSAEAVGRWFAERKWEA